MAATTPSAAGIPEDMRPAAPAWTWGLGLLIGLITIGVGILAIVYPDITLTALTIFVGIDLLLLAIVDLAEAVTSHDADGFARTMQAILGVVALFAGIVVLRNPGESLVVILIATGLYLLLVGVIGFVGAAFAPPGDRLRHVVGGAAAGIMGILVLSLPKLSLATVAVLVGIGLIFRGLALAFAAWQLRRVAA
jgi:uncharacterized membrane protein HdeD (DUF308 family)